MSFHHIETLYWYKCNALKCILVLNVVSVHWTRGFNFGFIMKVATGSRVFRPGKLDHGSSFPGFRESRLPHPTSSTLSISMCNSQRKKGAKIIHLNTAKKRFSFPRAVPRSRRGLSAVKLSVSPLDQWLKTPRYVHVSCTCNHNLPYGFKVNTKSWETWQRAVPAPNGKITEDFPDCHLDLAFYSRTSSCPDRSCSPGEASRCEKKHKLTFQGEKGRRRGLLGSGQTLREGRDQHLLTGRGNTFDIGSKQDIIDKAANIKEKRCIMWRVCGGIRSPGVARWFTCRHFKRSFFICTFFPHRPLMCVG